MDLASIRETVSSLARQAGAELMKNFDQPHQERTKRTITDIVTEGDLASEAVIVPALLRDFPDHHVVSEEGGGGGVSADTADYFWFIDPLDGTSNYASNIPFFCVSIALADRNMNPLVGVVYDPFSNELYSASQGGGATRNGKPIHVTGTAALQQAMLCTGFVYDSARDPNNNLSEWGTVNSRSRGVRRFGSIALELSYIAGGRLDGLWEKGLNPWDIMAGILLVREAGGNVTDYSGGIGNLLYRDGQIMATNGLIHGELMKTLEEVRAAK